MPRWWLRWELYCQLKDDEARLISRHWTRRGAEKKATFLGSYPIEWAYIMCMMPKAYWPVYTVRQRL